MASWPAAVDYAEAPRARRQGAVAARRGHPLRSGVLWIVVVGTLLASLVAVNVAVLQLNVRLDQLARERATLRDENAALASQFSSAKAWPRIQPLVRARLGLVPPSEVTYVELGR